MPRKKYQLERKAKKLAMAVLTLLAGSGLLMPSVYAAEPLKDSPPKVKVSQYHFSGQHLVDDSVLSALLADSVGKDFTLQDLEKKADILTRYLRAKGYMVAFAYIPPQDFANGNITIAIEPGCYDKITINNHTKIHDSAIRRELGKVNSGAVVKKDALERSVWLIGDLAGAETKTALAAGAKPGTTDITFEVNPKGKKQWGYAGIDNGGYPNTGRIQYSFLENWANPFREGDLLTFSGLYTGKGQTSGSLSYTTPVMDQGSRIGISYSRSRYMVGGAFAELGMTGTADTTSISYQKNFERSRNANWYGNVRYNYKKLHDEVQSFSLTDRKQSTSLVLGINGDTLDTWQGGGANTYSLTYTHGKLKILDAVYQSSDADAATGMHTAGSFDKYNLSMTRLQQIRDRLDLFLAYSYQWANKNLDSSEKLSLGGPYGVRAYPVGEATGDQGWNGTAELRYNLPAKEVAKNTWQLITFVDGGSVLQSKQPLASSTEVNRRSLYGMGVGVNWSRENNWAARVHYSWEIGSAKAQTKKEQSGRWWFQLYRFF